MDGIQHEYLRVNKYLLFVVSAWPYQAILQRSLIGIIVIPIVTAQLILQFGGMMTAIIAGDIESFLMKRLMDIMQEDWKFHARLRNEYEILCEHYAIARKITTSFVGR